MVRTVVCSVLHLVFICLTSGLLGSMGITVSNWQFYVILCSLIGSHVCGQLMDNPFQESKQYNSLPEETCSGCEHLAYNSDGSVECPLEYEHKCRPETRVMYKRQSNKQEIANGLD